MKTEWTMLRIIAGKHRNRRLQMIQSDALRPTSSRTRESIFNILIHGEWSEQASVLEGATVLDLYCGTGALGIEALSRGANHAIFIDMDPKHLAITRQNVVHVGELEHATFIRADSSHPPLARTLCDLVFLDPPYGKGLVAVTLQQLVAQKWLADNALVVVEISKHENMAIPPQFEELDKRIYGKTHIVILRFQSYG